MHRFKVGTGMVCGLLAGLSVSAWAADDTVLLQRGGVSITENEFTQLVNSLVPEQDRADFMSDQARVRRMLVDNYIVEALAHEAQAKGVDKDPVVVFRQQYQAKKDLAQFYLNTLLNQAEQPDWEQLAKESYIAEKGKFETPEMVNVSHVLVKAGDSRSDDEAAKRADEVYKKALAGKEDFAALVAEYSDDPSAVNNKGDMGLFGRGQMVKPFEDAAFAMSKPDSISKPVKTEFGYHIIKFHKHQAAGTQPFNAVRVQLINQAREKFAASVREKKLDSVRDADDIVVNKEAVDDLMARMASGAKASPAAK